MLFVFFKQKTAYEMRISDWSSDVCSSDLYAQSSGQAPVLIDSSVDSCTVFGSKFWRWMVCARNSRSLNGRSSSACTSACVQSWSKSRSEERRDGKECVSKCRSRWEPHH